MFPSHTYVFLHVVNWLKISEMRFMILKINEYQCFTKDAFVLNRSVDIDKPKTKITISGKENIGDTPYLVAKNHFS